MDKPIAIDLRDRPYVVDDMVRPVYRDDFSRPVRLDDQITSMQYLPGIVGVPEWAQGLDLYRDFERNYGSLPSPAGAHADPMLIQQADGMWVNRAANQSLLTDLGLWSLPTRINYFTNNGNSGAVAGSPGTTPTSWATFSTNGMTRQSVTLSTYLGLPLTTIRTTGTATGNNTSFTLTTSILANRIPLTPGEIITISGYFSVNEVNNKAGDNNGVSVRIAIVDSAGGSSSQLDYRIPSSSYQGNIEYFSRSFTVPAGYAYATVSLRQGFVIGDTYDFTYNLAGFTFEKTGAASTTEAVAGPPILTSGSYVAVSGNVPVVTGLNPYLRLGVCGYLKTDVKGFIASTLPTLLGLAGNTKVAQAIMQSTLAANTLTTGLQTIVFAVAPGYVKVRTVGQADTAAITTLRFDDSRERISFGNNGFDNLNNLYAIHKRFGLKVGAVNDTIFNQMYARAAA